MKELMDMLGGSLPMGKLKSLVMSKKPQEAHPLLKKLQEGQGNGGTPRTLKGLESKAKKLAQGKGRKGKEQERGKKQEQEKEQEVVDKAPGPC